MFETPRYRVSGTQPVFDRQPGEEFEADLDPADEQRLLSGGHLTRIDGAAPDEQQEDEAAAAAKADPEKKPRKRGK